MTGVVPRSIFGQRAIFRTWCEALSEVKLLNTAPLGNWSMLSIRPKSQAGRCAKHSFNQKLYVQAQSSKLNACSLNWKFIDKSWQLTPSPKLSGGGRRRSLGASPSTTPSSPPSRKAWWRRGKGKGERKEILPEGGGGIETLFYLIFS